MSSDESWGRESEAAFLAKMLEKAASGELPVLPFQFTPPSSMDSDGLPCDSRGGADDLTDKLPPNERQRRVERCFRELPVESLELIVLHDCHGTSWEEIAELKGYALRNVSQIKHARAFIKLGRLLRGESPASRCTDSSPTSPSDRTPPTARRE